ncbi:MAG: PaaI family thioesterase [Chryseobacterium sp.]|jgi:acyl-coenzyme A thioesterase 13|uniref:PaaI family thioesterase n=1 Tax=Chryseobacterium sp. TaxID=1871047 RepID=UPI00262AF6CA|nr:PaaI family thioesterase [Chryseobacterium sp.]MDF2551424.1 PaaI family thioesterase [Chryseobacterium sp.]
MTPLEKIQSFIGEEFTESPSPFMRWLNPIIVAAEQGKLEFQYAIRPEWLNPVGNLHGGVTAAIIDDIIGATMFSLNEAHFYITINNVIDYFSSVIGDESIVAKTTIIKKGKQFINAECETWNSDKSRLIAKGSSNLFKTEIIKY